MTVEVLLLFKWFIEQIWDYKSGFPVVFSIYATAISLIRVMTVFGQFSKFRTIKTCSIYSWCDSCHVADQVPRIQLNLENENWCLQFIIKLQQLNANFEENSSVTIFYYTKCYIEYKILCFLEL